ncbi:dTDP-glucose 4,6-dehydratase [Lysinibacillus sp. Ag94]|uniref:dTDP-glucose 4,6-dehydratase n=1 Tax=Lysinibacillus sp. Ag94 TaxID=2936682 RepID=UPI00200BA4D5|nr:dTDP-glucose 4,6-dehydratase [Lysinibacillus sp. Ag94]UPW83765.1 dTDP-glucose 4,6-dehydratase [Lysinibacillus sp. Ag94]
MRKILVTGGAGFIGANFLKYIIEKYPEYFVINIDNLTYASDYSNIQKLEQYKNYKFLKANICDQDIIEKVMIENEIDTIIHFAAESHVDNSIENPFIFAETNIMGTLNLLQQAYKEWFIKPFEIKEKYRNSRFIHISTDEVYGTLGEEGYFTEDSKYLPNSPYSASKAASDLLVRSYYHTYGMNVITTNCSNNFGPFQNKEKLIPKIIYNALKGLDLPIYGEGDNVRDWLFVIDHCTAINAVLHQGKVGETYLIGGHNEKKNLHLVHTICDILDERVPKDVSYRNQIKFVADRFGHDYRYAIDPAKIQRELNWKPQIAFEKALEETIDWYLIKYNEG